MKKRTIGGILGFVGLIVWQFSGSLPPQFSEYTARLTDHIQDIGNREARAASYTVTEVVDGDTLRVRDEREEYTVRLLGIDTPELAHRGSGRECFAREATTYLKERVEGKQLRLERDPTQKDTDRYGRLLRYVYVSGTHPSVNYQIVHNGYGFEYTHNIPYQYQSRFRRAQREARETGAGLWNEQTCNGEVSPRVSR